MHDRTTESSWPRVVAAYARETVRSRLARAIQIRRPAAVVAPVCRGRKLIDRRVQLAHRRGQGLAFLPGAADLVAEGIGGRCPRYERRLSPAKRRPEHELAFRRCRAPLRIEL